MKHLAPLLLFSAAFLIAAPSTAQESQAPVEASKPGAGGGGGADIGFKLRTGVTFDYAAGDPNFFGIGGLVEPTIGIDNLGVGLRIDGMALFGVNLGDDIAAGIRALAAVLPKVEYAFGPLPVKPVVGLAGGYYTVAVTGATVSSNDDVGALAGGGRAFGFAPQAGIDIGGFRIAALAHFVFAGAGLEPVFALELSWKSFEFP